MLVVALSFLLLGALVSAYFMLESGRLGSEIERLQSSKHDGLADYFECVQALRDLRLEAGVNCYACDSNGCAKLNVTLGGEAG